MKRLLSLIAGLAVIGLSGTALAQTNDYDYDRSWTNYFNVTNNFDYNHLWGTNNLCLTNTPQSWSNYYQHTFKGPANTGPQVQSRFGKQSLPTDVQTIVQDFKRDRTRLMDRLKTCSDEERQLILQDMEQLRIQLQDQICECREQAQQQAEQMRNRFGNGRDRLLDQGAGTTGPGRDR